jgi:glycosyltransferase involved in cell wall biosynthesis
MRGADMLTTLSPDNLREARRLFPEKRCELVRFGIDSAYDRPPFRSQVHRPIRILSPGTDMHRDWDTLVEAVRNWNEAEVRIASRRLRSRRWWPRNLTIVRPTTAQEMRDLYDWADVVVVTLQRNLHVSGITVIMEAISLGVPVICTDTGGLRAYFSEEEIGFVTPGSSHAIRQKLEELVADDQGRLERTVRAQWRLLRDQLTSYAYAIRHRELSESLL